MWYGVSVWVIVAPILAAQYITATVGLVFLGRRQMPRWQYVLWNVCILLVFFAGTIAFFIYNAARPQHGDAPTEADRAQKSEEETDGDTRD